MEKELLNSDKELLLKDICSRLPYGVKCSFGVNDAIYIIEGINPNSCGASEIQATHIKSGINGYFKINYFKPYLFPLSSMTKEQKKEYDSIVFRIDIYSFEELQEFYLKNHFDYHHLIDRNLAIDATGLNIY